MRGALMLTLIAGAVCLAAGCRSPEPIRRQADSIADIAGLWSVETMNGSKIEGRPPTLDIGQDGRVGGFAGVNRFTTTLDLQALREGRFRVEPAAMTRMAGPPEAMALESAFMQMLLAADTAAIEGTRLRLSGGDTVAVFGRIEDGHSLGR